MLEPSITHDRAAESDRAKVAWFRSLPIEDRMDLLCEFTDLILERNPAMGRPRDAEPPSEHIRILTLP